MVWKAAHELTLRVYAATRGFPRDERFGLSAQLRRSSASIAANIAEGSKAATSADFARILNIAEKEAAETGYHVILARDLGYLPPNAADELLERTDHLSRMLNRLRTRLRPA